MIGPSESENQPDARTGSSLVGTPSISRTPPEASVGTKSASDASSVIEEFPVFLSVKNERNCAPLSTDTLSIAGSIEKPESILLSTAKTCKGSKRQKTIIEIMVF